MAAFTLKAIISGIPSPANVTLVHLRVADRVGSSSLIRIGEVTIMPSRMGEIYDLAVYGSLALEFEIAPDGNVGEAILGGTAIYAAVGARVWSDSVGMVARVGRDFPSSWLADIQRHGIAVEGVRILNSAGNLQQFVASEFTTVPGNTPSSPRHGGMTAAMLLAIRDRAAASQAPGSTQGTEMLSLHPEDVDQAPLPSRAAHVCPGSVYTQAVLPARLRGQGVPGTTLDPGDWLDGSTSQRDRETIIRGLDAFLPSEKAALTFSGPHQPALGEAAEAYGGMGCRFVVIKCGAVGQHVYDSAARTHWQVPAYPVQVRHTNGAGDAYCGGFLAGLARTGDPIHAALCGTVSASFVLEGPGAFYALGAVPGLAQARMDAIRGLVRRV